VKVRVGREFSINLPFEFAAATGLAGGESPSPLGISAIAAEEPADAEYPSSLEASVGVDEPEADPRASVGISP
jgi:hypothetical protein